MTYQPYHGEDVTLKPVPMNDPFYAIITDDRTGEELARHELADEDLLDCDVYAARYAQSIEQSIARPIGYVPTGCADFTVTLTDQPGGVRCWNSQSYFFSQE